ncbi:tol-pal system protein YbgF [Agrobacterium sp. SHOUNA12C]|uniref:Cell division coordinator CpoB n=2 Tax=Rhizobium rhizogenes TaxID=359 RepID=B9J9H3_RHIR8|nr:tol-pal system protein YbgF [Rhizobium rhizogenes]ACM27575.1 tol-pal system protein YbgF [Rhizobium rhizogenes K84]MCJ9720760.1 tol-pal system protein YbgF [Agrobacterium sp. BETTINA12B]MCJ9756989.1 tol-pal system protein YbgF [Agrobacterium sp. SHOUNA12C]OCI92256.1 tol-pal system protein YbgF [Agrobacterium sp. 13-626]KEA05854.1 tol-pal system protein [Rhizobium rhizogenes]
MRKLVVASVLCLVAIVGSERDASALSLFGLHLGGRGASEQAAPSNAARLGQAEQAPVIKIQSSNAEVRLQQLEDQMRQLNGRVEEMSYQLLQMQEQIRKTQEDNEFRFQQLEKRGGGGGGNSSGGGSANPPGGGTTTIGGGSMKKSEADVPAQAPTGGQQDDIAGVIGDSGSDMPATAQQGGGSGKPPTQLGSIQLDQNGKQIGATASRANNSSGAPPSAGSGTQTASLGSENDEYKAAYGHVLSGDYSVAEQEFRQYIDSYPSSSRSADANFWLGEALYSQGKYNDAAKTFLNAHQKYSTSEKAPEMLLKLGMSLAALDNKDTACATLREVTKRYPKASKPVTNKVASEEKRLAC